MELPPRLKLPRMGYPTYTLTPKKLGQFCNVRDFFVIMSSRCCRLWLDATFFPYGEELGEGNAGLFQNLHFLGPALFGNYVLQQMLQRLKLPRMGYPTYTLTPKKLGQFSELMGPWTGISGKRYSHA